ncbi:hypothetical protein C8J56DRAFT_1066136 [Mycena floridula]|nr:hypothetical protein C8J56DRAFT_1066136 [Mycena floridula]
MSIQTPSRHLLLTTWKPPPELVALRYMWDKQNEVREFVQWLCVTDVSGFSQANDYIRACPLDTPKTVMSYTIDARYGSLHGTFGVGEFRVRCAGMVWGHAVEDDAF